MLKITARKTGLDGEWAGFYWFDSKLISCVIGDFNSCKEAKDAARKEFNSNYRIIDGELVPNRGDKG